MLVGQVAGAQLRRCTAIPAERGGWLQLLRLRPRCLKHEDQCPPTLQIFEVELIDWKSVKDIAGDGGVIKTIVKEGSGWAKPLPKDEVRVRCGC